MTTSLKPDEIFPETIENVFRSAMIYVEDKKVFASESGPGAFVCTERGQQVGIKVDPKEKLIQFRVGINKSKEQKESFAFHPVALNSLQAILPMVRIISEHDVIWIDYQLNAECGIHPIEMIAAFRRFVNIVQDVKVTLVDFLQTEHGGSVIIDILKKTVDPPKTGEQASVDPSLRN